MLRVLSDMDSLVHSVTMLTIRRKICKLVIVPYLFFTSMGGSVSCQMFVPGIIVARKNRIVFFRKVSLFSQEAQNDESCEL